MGDGLGIGCLSSRSGLECTDLDGKPWPSGAATVNVRTREAAEVLEQIWMATKARLKPRGLPKPV